MTLQEKIDMEPISKAEKIKIIQNNKTIYYGTIMNIPKKILNYEVDGDLFLSLTNRYEIVVK